MEKTLILSLILQLAFVARKVYTNIIKFYKFDLMYNLYRFCDEHCQYLFVSTRQDKHQPLCSTSLTSRAKNCV